MPRLAVGILTIVVLLIAGGALALSACEDDWCQVFTWQKVRAAKSFEDCARLGFPVQESYPRVCRAGDKSFTESVPAGTNEPPFATESQNIKVTSPRPNEIISGQVVIAGEARTFESNVLYRVKDSSGKVLAFGNTTATAPDTGQFGPFQVTVAFSPPASSSGTVEVYEGSAKDGSEINKVTIPVLFR